MLDLPALYAECAPNVHPSTMARLVEEVESGGDPLAINVNRLPAGAPRPRDAADAARIARAYIARGFSVDIGLGQINSRNLPRLGMTVEQAFRPCSNLRGSAAILGADYNAALRRFPEGRPALLAALSRYNTGTFHRGLSNGYVARYFPGLRSGRAAVHPAAATSAGAPARQRAADPYTAPTQVLWMPGG